MEDNIQLIDLSDCSKDQILIKITQILQLSQFQTFTLLLKRTTIDQKTQQNLKQKSNPKQKIKRINSLGEQTRIIQKNVKKHSRFSQNHVGILKMSSQNRKLQKNQQKLSYCPRNQSQLAQTILDVDLQVQQIPKSLQFYYEGQYAQALIQFYTQEIDLKQKIQDYKQNSIMTEKNMEQYARLMINIGNCYFNTKNYQKAIQYFKKQIQSDKVDQRLIGQKYNNLGSCYAHQKQNQQSLKCFNQALKIYAKYPDLDCSNLLKNIGIIYFRNGMYTSCQSYFQQSIQQRRLKSPQNQQALLNTYYKLGLCQKYIGKFFQATNNMLFALNISQKGYDVHHTLIREIANIYQLQQKYGDALIYYQKMNICQGQIYQSVAKIHHKIGNFQEHDKFMKLAIADYKKFNHQRKLSEYSSLNYLLQNV